MFGDHKVKVSLSWYIHRYLREVDYSDHISLQKSTSTNKSANSGYEQSKRAKKACGLSRQAGGLSRQAGRLTKQAG
jgi:hypothetical protein